MKFRIRFADQIVGFFIIFSLVSLAFVIVMLGSSQRWFANDASFFTTLPSATGLSKNMAVQYLGFTIGSVKAFYLTEKDEVAVIFVIHEEYRHRVKKGSMVELMASPVGLGNQFNFYAGTGEELEEGSVLPVVGSAQARELIRQGLADEPQRNDSISVILSRVNSIFAQLDEALGPGTDASEIGKIVGSIQTALAGAEGIPESADRMIRDIQAQLRPILANVNTLITELNDPGGLLYTVLDTDREVYTSMVKSLNSASGLLDNLDRTTAFIPGQLPQIAGLIMDLRVTLKSVEDVLIALTNNPLLRKGVPDRLETHDSGTSPRDIRF